MLTPADFIFNEQSSSQYVEFNYTPITLTSDRYASYSMSEYLLKISDESSTFSSKQNIHNSHNNFQSFNITFAENVIQELKSFIILRRLGTNNPNFGEPIYQKVSEIIRKLKLEEIKRLK